MAAKCTVRFERPDGAGPHQKSIAVLYARDGHALSYVPVYAPVTVSKARQAKAYLMRGCAELSRKLTPVRRVPLSGARKRKRR